MRSLRLMIGHHPGPDHQCGPCIGNVLLQHQSFACCSVITLGYSTLIVLLTSEGILLPNYKGN